jgi:hypothetical protein
MTRIILQKKFLPASHDDLLLAFQTLDIGMLTSFQLIVALNYVITSCGGFCPCLIIWGFPYCQPIFFVL